MILPFSRDAAVAVDESAQNGTGRSEPPAQHVSRRAGQPHRRVEQVKNEPPPQGRDGMEDVSPDQHRRAVNEE